MGMNSASFFVISTLQNPGGLLDTVWYKNKKRAVCRASFCIIYNTRQPQSHTLMSLLEIPFQITQRLKRPSAVSKILRN